MVDNILANGWYLFHVFPELFHCQGTQIVNAFQQGHSTHEMNNKSKFHFTVSFQSLASGYSCLNDTPLMYPLKHFTAQKSTMFLNVIIKTSHFYNDILKVLKKCDRTNGEPMHFGGIQYCISSNVYWG